MKPTATRQNVLKIIVNRKKSIVQAVVPKRVLKGRTYVRPEAAENFFIVPLHFKVLPVQLVVSVSAFVMSVHVQFGQFLVCCSFNHDASLVPSHL